MVIFNILMKRGQIVICEDITCNSKCGVIEQVGRQKARAAAEDSKRKPRVVGKTLVVNE